MKKKIYPVIIFNRGSYIRNDISIVHVPLFKKLVQSGFIVIAPALRESEGGEGKDELGGKDLNDIMNLLPLLSGLSYADTANIFLLGESRGGIMTYLSIKNKFPVKAAAVIGGISDMGKYINNDFPAGDKLFSQIYTDYTTRRKDILSSRSAVNWPDSFNVPILIMHGELDAQVKPVYAMDIANKLSEKGKTFQLIILEGGNHILSGKHSYERDKQVIEWFRKYL